MKDKSTIWGTCHFCSFAAANIYYSNLHSSEVQKKINAGEIVIGKPTVKPGEKLYLNKEEGRYFIGAK